MKVIDHRYDHKIWQYNINYLKQQKSFKMGPKNSKQSQTNFMKDYDIIQTNQTQNITYLQHKKTQDDYLLKQFNFNDKKQCEKTMDKLAQLKTKLAGNKHVVPLKDYLMSSQDQYCSTFYKIYALFEYPQRTLDDQINQRKLQRKKFSQTQLWSILASCIVGLSHLQKNGIKHSALKSSNILLSKQGLIKICDPYPITQPTNYQSALTKRSSLLHGYLSPQQCQSLQQQAISPVLNPYKSDIFTLGMIMLQAGLLEYQDQECYRDDKSRIHWETVQYNVDRLGQMYSQQIKNMVEFMLSKDQRARPDWIDLQQHVMKGGGDQVRRSFIQQQQSVNNNTMNRDTFLSNQPTELNRNTVLSEDINSNRPISLHAQRGRNSSNQPPIQSTTMSNPPSLGNIGNNNAFVIGHTTSPRVAGGSVSANQTGTFGGSSNSIIGGNNTFGRYSRPQSPRVRNSTSNVVMYNNQPITSTIPVTTASYMYNTNTNTNTNTHIPVYTHLPNPLISANTLMSSTTYPPTSISNFAVQQGGMGASVPPQSTNNINNNVNNVGMISSNSGIQTAYSAIAPLKPSNIDMTRPTKNIFPSDTYVNRTKFDQNLIIMTQDDETIQDNDNFLTQNSQNSRQPQQQQQYPSYINAPQYQQHNQQYNPNIYINNRVNQPINQQQVYQQQPQQMMRINNNNNNNNMIDNNNNNMIDNNNNNNNRYSNVVNVQQPQLQQQQPVMQHNIIQQQQQQNQVDQVRGYQYQANPGQFPTQTQTQLVNILPRMQQSQSQQSQQSSNNNVNTNSNNTNSNNTNSNNTNSNNTNNVNNNSNGQLKFVTQQFKMGSRYQGYKLNNLRHGYGKFYYQDGGMYDGDWFQNKMQGFGKLYYQSGKLAYQGMWKNDQFYGKGVLYNQMPDQMGNNGFNYNNMDDVDQYWTKYQGQFLDDMKNGKGVLYLSNGERFQGTFVADIVQGPGIFYCLNGQKIAGNWVGNVKVNQAPRR